MTMDEQQHVALPTLYGAPAYARPEPIAAVSPRPFDPDDLPIAAVQTDEERELVASLPAHFYAPGGSMNGSHRVDGDAAPELRPRPLSLKALAGRILGQSDN